MNVNSENDHEIPGRKVEYNFVGIFLYFLKSLLIDECQSLNN